MKKYKRIEGMTYIYGLWPPGVEQTLENCRYIGKTVDIRRRLNEHLATAAKWRNHRDLWIKSLLVSSLKPELKVLAIVPDRVWETCEINMIKIYKSLGADLTNQTDGGDTGPDITGFKNTKEHNDKIRRAKTGKKRKPFSDEWRKRMSEVRLGEKNPMFGKRHSDETKKLISDAARNISLETRKLMSEANSGENNPMFGRTGEKNPMFGRTGEKNPMYGKKHSEEAKQKMREALKKYYLQKTLGVENA
jgi:group I intron endonuclease